MAPGFRDAKRRADLLGAAGGDPEEVSPVASTPASSFAEVQRDRAGGVTDLAGELAIASPQRPDERAELLDDADREIESDEAHGRGSVG